MQTDAGKENAHFQPKLGFGLDLRCKLMQDKGLLTSNQNLDLD